jgi:DUF1680 family protein
MIGQNARFLVRRFSARMVFAVISYAWLAPAAIAGDAVDERGKLVVDRVRESTFRFDGPIGERIGNSVDRWLTQAPRNNPGLLDMFARRDSGIKPDLVPWAGEFVGKYLISGVQAMRMSDDPKWRQTLQTVVDRLVELQADDGYLGPWPKNERLRGHWDLWGHYHVMLGLMLWHEQTGDDQAALAAERIAKKVCDTCLDSGFRVRDAGSPEMNMSVVHGLGRLYRKTGKPAYLEMAREVLKDFESAGDYYRTGLAGREFYRTPRPRWESLHCLQGLVELYRITGDESFRASFLHHWASMRRFDYRNTGGFSSGERATGNPYADTAIETCCVIAWQAVMLDAFRLTGRATIADDLERTLLNAVFGSQHPSGAWCTYNTPMAGQRIPSHIHIRFQARADTPELNCCSVNGPRGYGMLSEWAVMRGDDGLVLNYYGPMTARVSLADGTPVTITQATEYPCGKGQVAITVNTPAPKRFNLRLRLPGWSSRTQVTVAGRPMPTGDPGTFLQLDREWAAGDKIGVKFDMRVRYEPGDLEQAGRAALYRGPILLAWDDRFRTEAAAEIDVDQLDQAAAVPVDEAVGPAAGEYPPWLVVDVPNVDGQALRLIDFASAGATQPDGKPLSRYTTWFPAKGMRPPTPVAFRPPDRSRIGLGPIRFAWRASKGGASQYTVAISRTPSFEEVALRHSVTSGSSLVVPAEVATGLPAGETYYWKVVAENEHGSAASIPPYKQFVIDPSAPAMGDQTPGVRASDKMVTAASLRGEVKPDYGVLVHAAGWKPAAGPKGRPATAVELDGSGGIIRYRLLGFPEENYSVSVWVALTRPHGRQYGQVFSAWTGGMDDPLRLVVVENRLYARIEAGQFYGTKGVPLEVGRWTHVAAVKQGEKLTLYVDGASQVTADVPVLPSTASDEFALGGNPRYSGPEFLACKLADLKFYARALPAAEVKQDYEAGKPTGD